MPKKKNSKRRTSLSTHTMEGAKRKYEAPSNDTGNNGKKKGEDAAYS